MQVTTENDKVAFIKLINKFLQINLARICLHKLSEFSKRERIVFSLFRVLSLNYYRETNDILFVFASDTREDTRDAIKLNLARITLDQTNPVPKIEV